MIFQIILIQVYGNLRKKMIFLKQFIVEVLLKKPPKESIVAKVERYLEKLVERYSFFPQIIIFYSSTSLLALEC